MPQQVRERRGEEGLAQLGVTLIHCHLQGGRQAGGKEGESQGEQTVNFQSHGH